MEVYLVGGAVRDELLGYPTEEYDYVVVGATPEKMLSLGYTPVGKDFPVFLHPETKDEYALARTERKSGHGYLGFTFNTAPDITLEEDLVRRDLTINAIAKSEDGNYIDPYRGQEDLKAKTLRHVSDAFREDPVRILRTARFAARYHHLGFSIADETLALMTAMVNEGEANHLVIERIWKEFSRALGEKSPEVFINYLDRCGALQVISPEIAQYISAQPSALENLKQASQLTENINARLACLLKTVTPNSSGNTAPLIFAQLGAPKETRELVSLVIRHYSEYKRVLAASAEDIFQLFSAIDALRRNERFENFIEICEIALTIDEDNLSDKATSKTEQNRFLREALRTVLDVSAQQFLEAGLKGHELGNAIQQARIERLKQLKRQ